ncbi:outer membrane protein [Arboricoccus pini]|uniref:Outer membrane protein n=1 Tax=Arboricoccus pini TaxID=1963835 RepID=A0A212R9G5_9PROT|nr:TolC family outer membrane protein [Arboricoccus pini]SNB68841.1 outer membrane protein [Arboricoccus pini]
MPARKMNVAGLALAASLVAMSAQADSLDTALVEAYLGNPDLKAARDELRATDEQVPQALSGYRPTVGLQGSYTRTDGQGGLDRDAVGRGNGGRTSSFTNLSRSGSLVINQNLYQGGGTVASVSQAENQVRAQRASLVATEQSTLLSATQAYVNAWVARATLDESLQNEVRLRRQLQATQDRFQVGEVARTDVAQAEASLAGAHADVEAAKSNVASADATYRQVIGRAPGKLQQPSKLLLLPGSIDEAYALARNNPDIIQSTYQLAAAKDNIDVQFASLLPTLDFQATFGRQDDPVGSSFRWSKSSAVGLQLTIPLYQGGAEFSRVRQAKQRMRQSRNQLESVNRTVEQSVGANWDNLAAQTAQIESRRAQVRANEIALEGVQQEALVGTRTVLDVLDAEQALFNSKVQLIRSQGEEVLASYELKQAVGQLTTVALNLSVDPYDADAYYARNRNRLVGTGKNEK